MTRVLTASDGALLIETADLDEMMRLLWVLQEARLPGVLELIPGARTVLVRFDPTVVRADDLATRLLLTEPGGIRPGDAAEVTIPVRYDGDDLAEVAELLSVTPEELIARHQAAAWTVAFTGFAPGFGYLAGDDPLFDVPRRPSPRTRIPAGAVALAGRFSGVYPTASPGGWQLIGRTDAALWSLDRDPPALLTPGTRVRFEAIERELRIPRPDRPRPVASSHAVFVVRPGLQLSVQDWGRPGLAAQGVSAAGAADRGALREANRAVGNRPAEAGLELAGGGAVLRFRGPAVVAITGALAEATVAGIRIEHGQPFAVDDGEELRIGSLADGLRAFVGIRGGIACEAVLGSRSTDTLAGLGPALLTAGDRLPLAGPEHGVTAVDTIRAARMPLPRPGETVELEIVLGPRADWFAESALVALTDEVWEVTAESDRVGVRLRGRALTRSRTGELESEGLVTGAIQVPPNGQPVVFLADHPLTGGYPVIGAVTARQLDLAAQLPPGARVRFRLREDGA